jgi:hypothetical protein
MKQALRYAIRQNYIAQYDVAVFSRFPYLEKTDHPAAPLLPGLKKIRPVRLPCQGAGSVLATRTDANMLWMCLYPGECSRFPSRTPTIAAAANYPYACYATATTHDAAIAASVMSALATTATGGLPYYSCILLLVPLPDALAALCWVRCCYSILLVRRRKQDNHGVYQFCRSVVVLKSRSPRHMDAYKKMVCTQPCGHVMASLTHDFCSGLVVIL